MILGILVSLGTTKLSAITLGIVLFYLLWVALYHRRKVSLPVPILIITVCIALSAIWSVNPGKPVYLCLHILTTYLAYKVFPHKHFTWGISLIAAIQIGVILWQYLTTDIVRPYGLSRNASVLGLAAMWGSPLWITSILAGLSISRTAVIGALLLGFTGRRYILPALVVIGVFLVTTLLTNPDRISLSGLIKSSDLRIATIQGTSKELPPTITDPITGELKPGIILPEFRDVNWKWYGYGWGQYVLKTSRIQPHNIFVRTWYEMGIFSIPVGYCLIYLWASRNQTGRFRDHDWRLLLVACATGMLTDELLGSVEGVYMVLTYAIINRPAQRLMRERVAAPALST